MGSGLEQILALVYCGNGIVLAGSGNNTGEGDIYRSDVGFSQASTIQGIYHEHLTGNIGIGTTNPEYTLDVGGDTNIDGNFTVGGNLLVQGDTELVSGVSTGFISAVGIQSGGNQIGTGITTINFIGVGNTVKVNGTTVDVSIEGGASGVGTAIKYSSNTKSPFSYINATTYVTENIVLDTTNAGNDYSYVVVQEPRIIVQTGVAVTVGLGKTLVTDLYQLGDL